MAEGALLTVDKPAETSFYVRRARRGSSARTAQPTAGKCPHLPEPNAGGGPRIAPLETLCTARLPSAVKDHSAPSTDEWRTFRPADLDTGLIARLGTVPLPRTGQVGKDQRV
jgi:hypothetical protein